MDYPLLLCCLLISSSCDGHVLSNGWVTENSLPLDTLLMSQGAVLLFEWNHHDMMMMFFDVCKRIQKELRCHVMSNDSTLLSVFVRDPFEMWCSWNVDDATWNCSLLWFHSDVCYTPFDHHHHRLLMSFWWLSKVFIYRSSEWWCRSFFHVPHLRPFHSQFNWIQAQWWFPFFHMMLRNIRFWESSLWMMIISFLLLWLVQVAPYDPDDDATRERKTFDGVEESHLLLISYLVIIKDRRRGWWGERIEWNVMSSTYETSHSEVWWESLWWYVRYHYYDDTHHWWSWDFRSSSQNIQGEEIRRRGRSDLDDDVQLTHEYFFLYWMQLLYNFQSEERERESSFIFSLMMMILIIF